MSSPRPRPALDRAAVLARAVELADEGGLEPPSMRRLAESLGVTPMALYHHVADHEALVDGMVETVLEAIADTSTEGGWRPAVRRRILAARAEILAHPWATRAIETRHAASAPALAHMDWIMRRLFEGGLSADLVHHAMHALSTRMWGFTREVFPTPTMPEGAEERAAALAGFASRYPSIVRMATTAPHASAECDSDAEFAFALDLLLDGIERRHEGGWSSELRS
ncbi:MAG: TetR/AcrR family transcriptional regulator C-terminal domain-containing protein [Actinomycetales bacterium]|nr:TetR/AcrR family transcriptional regulator C-terminal domain-containing protein [Actinomycetales bacterium]